MASNFEQLHQEPIQLSNINVDPVHNRYTWLDLLRSVVLIFLFISSLTWVFSADIRGGELPIGPTWLNYGWKYANFYPRMITLIDLGSQIFMFILGLSITISFRKKKKTVNIGYAWVSVLNRVFVFFWLAEVMLTDFLVYKLNDIIVLSIWVAITAVYCILRFTKFKASDASQYLGLAWAFSSCILWFLKFDSDLWTIFFTHDLALLAWGTLLGALFIFLIEKPDIRIILSVLFIVTHFILWERFQDFEIILVAGTPFEFTFKFPFEILSMGVVVITASCLWDWIAKEPKDLRKGIRSRWVPLMVITLIGHFAVDFFQTANSEGFNTSITLLAISFSSFLALCIFAIDNYIKFKSDVLTTIGKNGLFLFLLQALLTIPYTMFWPEGGNDFRVMVSNWLGVSRTHVLVNIFGLLAFIVPIAILLLTAWILHKFKVRIGV